MGFDVLRFKTPTRKAWIALHFNRIQLCGILAYHCRDEALQIFGQDLAHACAAKPPYGLIRTTGELNVH